MDDLKTPVARLARLFRDARDKWKAKALERQKRLRAAQVRIRDLEHSRAYWKGRALAAEERDAESDTAAKTPVEDEDDQPSYRITPVANHHHALEVMQLSLQLFLHASLGCRGVSGVLQQFAAFLPLSVPAYTTVLNWSVRLGLAVLTASPAAPRRLDLHPRSDDRLGRIQVSGRLGHSRQSLEPVRLFSKPSRYDRPGGSSFKVHKNNIQDQLLTNVAGCSSELAWALSQDACLCNQAVATGARTTP